jgi:hypothetical protein
MMDQKIAIMILLGIIVNNILIPLTWLLDLL